MEVTREKCLPKGWCSCEASGTRQEALQLLQPDSQVTLKPLWENGDDMQTSEPGTVRPNNAGEKLGNAPGTFVKALTKESIN